VGAHDDQVRAAAGDAGDDRRLVEGLAGKLGHGHGRIGSGYGLDHAEHACSRVRAMLGVVIEAAEHAVRRLLILDQ